MSKEIVIRRTTESTRNALFGAVGFTIMGVAMLFIEDDGGRFSSIAPVIGVVSILFFGVGAIVLGRRLAGDLALLTLTSKGIVARDRLIAWGDLESMELDERFGSRFVVARLRDPEAFNAELSSAARLTHRAQRGELWFPSSGLTIEPDEFERLMLERWRRSRRG